MKNKKGKKLVVLGAMAALLTLIGVSGSQTYAKYVEGTKTTSQTATVAKWDYVVTMNADNLFAKAHKANVVDLSTKASDTDAKVVLSAGSSNIVAPGVAGFMTFGVVGHSEVLATHTIDFDVTKQVKLTYDTDKTYMPIKWTLERHNGTEYEKVTFANGHDMDYKVISSLDYTHDLRDIEKYFATNGTGTVINQQVEKLYRLSYSWAFYTDAAHDELDTQLGELANTDPTLDEVQIAFTVGAGVVQVQA